MMDKILFYFVQQNEWFVFRVKKKSGLYPKSGTILAQFANYLSLIHDFLVTEVIKKLFLWYYFSLCCTIKSICSLLKPSSPPLTFLLSVTTTHTTFTPAKPAEYRHYGWSRSIFAWPQVSQVRLHFQVGVVDHFLPSRRRPFPPCSLNPLTFSSRGSRRCRWPCSGRWRLWISCYCWYKKRLGWNVKKNFCLC